MTGIDSVNIDDLEDLSRPAHAILLGAGIPVCEHMTNLTALPSNRWTTTCRPDRIERWRDTRDTCLRDQLSTLIGGQVTEQSRAGTLSAYVAAMKIL